VWQTDERTDKTGFPAANVEIVSLAHPIVNIHEPSRRSAAVTLPSALASWAWQVDKVL